MSEESLKQVQAAVISAKTRAAFTPEEARDLALNVPLKFKQERGRLPSITSADAWEKKMAEGVAYLARMKAGGRQWLIAFTEDDDALLS